MALNESNVENRNYRDRKYSSGDSNKIKCKQYQEENNNNIDELSQHLSEMGCIVDAVKRPPNICIETCVYEDPNERDDPNDNNTNTRTHELNNDEANYSDEFDEASGSDGDEINVVNKTAPIERSSGLKIDKTLLKSVDSLSSTVCKPQSTRSSDYSSISVSQTRRKNMSFSNTRLRDIERQNHILLTKILSARSKKSSIPPRDQPVWKPVPAAAVHRKRQQKKIDHDNMILLKKIQTAKSSAGSRRR